MPGNQYFCTEFEVNNKSSFSSIHMKKIVLFLSIAGMLFSLTGCMYSYPPRPRPLTEIPLRPHRNEVKIYLPGEKPDNPDYYKVAGMDVPIGFGNFNDKLNAFKVQGQQLGIDAVLLVGSTPGHDFDPAMMGAVNAIGIKYRDSLSYIRDYLKRKDVYVYLPGGGTSLVYQANFDMFGDEGANMNFRKDTVYERYVQRYSLDYLMNAIWGWQFRMDGWGNITKRVKYRAPGVPELTCTFTYNGFANVESITIDTPASANGRQRRLFEKMLLQYDVNQQVTGKLIYDSRNNLRYREQIQYDATGRVKETTLYSVRGEQELPLVTSLHLYYTPDDLPPITKGL
jgi:hypothetical protein